MLPLLAALVIAPPVRVWQGPDAGGAWNVPANWSGGVTPQPGELVYLGGTDSSRTITLSGAGSTVAGVFGGKTLIIDGVTLKLTGDPVEVTSFEDTRLRNHARIELGGGRVQGTVALDGGEIDVTGPVHLSGRYSGTGQVRIAPGGAVDAGNLVVAAPFENDGALTADVPMELDPSADSISDGSFAIGAGGIVHVRPKPGVTFTIGGPALGPGRFELTDDGAVRTLDAFAPGELRTVYPARLSLGGTSALPAGAFLDGPLENTGPLTASSATGTGPMSNAGTFTVSGTFGTGGTYTQSGGLTNVLAGARLDKDVVLDGGVLKGKGTVRSLVNHGGIVEPGASPGTLSVAGDFAQTGGTLRIEDGDLLAVGGNATLGGTLEVVTPLAGPLRFLSATSISGTWGSVSGCVLATADTCSPAPVPVPTVSPVPPAPTPVLPRAAKARVVFPARCRHGITLRLSGDVRRATIKVNGKRVKTLTRAGTVKLKLKRRARVTVAVVLTDGRTLTRTKRYPTC
jgi:hypothetical protein